MSKDDQKEQPFPEGYGHVGDRLNDTLGRLQQADEAIKTIPKDQGPVITYRTPGSIGRRQPGTRDSKILLLNAYKDELRTAELDKVEADTREADSQTGRVVRDRVRETLFPNPYRQASAEERALYQNEPKEIEQSQDYMDALIVEHKDKQPAREELQAETTENKDNAMSMSARFTMSLNFTKATEPASPGNGPSQTREREKDMDRD